MSSWRDRAIAFGLAVALGAVMVVCAQAVLAHDHCNSDTATGRTLMACGPVERWCGLAVLPEVECPSYRGEDWPYPSDLDQRYADRIGGFFAPYTGRVFDHAGQVDIEHIVARHEAAQSGACGWGVAERKAFARDPLEITIAGPMVNRRLKSDRDPAEWMPEKAQAWYAARWIAIKRRYGLSVDEAERDALAAALGGRCP